MRGFTVIELIVAGSAILILGFVGGWYQYNQPTGTGEGLLVIEGQISDLETKIDSLGVIPVQFIAAPATTTEQLNFAFLIATSTAEGHFGSSTLMIYGSTTIQTSIDTEHAFEIFNSGTTTIFQVDTLNSSTTIRNALTVNDLTVGTCTGCAVDPITNLIQFTEGQTVYFAASTTDSLAWLFRNGFVSQASSTFSVGTTTIQGITIPNSVTIDDIGIYGFGLNSAQQGIIIESKGGQAQLRLAGSDSNAGQIIFHNMVDSGMTDIGHLFMDGAGRLDIQSDGFVQIGGTSGLEFFSNNTKKWAIDATALFPNGVNKDLGKTSAIIDEIFVDELVITNAGTAATAANTIRLGGQDDGAGNAGLLITTEDDTDYLFASRAGFASTTPWAQLSLEMVQGVVSPEVPAFVIADQGTSTPIFIIDANGQVGIASSTPGSIFSIGNSLTDFINLSDTATSTFGNGMRIIGGALQVDNLIEKKLLAYFDNAIVATSTIYRSKTWSITIASSTMSTTTDVAQHKFSFPFIFTRVTCSTDQGTSTIQFDERAEATPNTVGTAVMGASAAVDMECGSEFTSATTSFQNAEIAADVPLNFQIVDAELTGLVPTQIRIHIEGVEAITLE